MRSSAELRAGSVCNDVDALSAAFIWIKNGSDAELGQRGRVWLVLCYLHLDARARTFRPGVFRVELRDETRGLQLP